MTKAIKKAQTERFLPLVAIKQMLEENGFDHGSLNVQEPPDLERSDADKLEEEKSRSLEKIPLEILNEYSSRGWAPPFHSDSAAADDSIPTAVFYWIL